MQYAPVVRSASKAGAGRAILPNPGGVLIKFHPKFIIAIATATGVLELFLVVVPSF
jgi:hypothetical protein